jgi:ribonucleoside-diphosphate reductase alpha chain
LSNLTDDRLRNAKTGEFGITDPQRYLANNSACYTEKPDLASFMKEWMSLYASKTGERGFFSRVASKKQAAKNGRREEAEFGTNPCSEIILRPNQFCNLSEVVVRPEDTLESIKEKVRKATVLGTLQATLTDFRYLRSVWKRNTEEEALLGVSLTGIMDHRILSGTLIDDAYATAEFCGNEAATLPEILEELKQTAIDTNKEWAKKLGINQSVAITCVKPSGTVSQLVDSASGIHPRYAPYYIRRVRASVTDPLCKVLQDAGVPSEPAVGQDSTLVFSFPQKAPEGGLCTKELGAMKHLELWKIYQDHWCEHKPSITVNYTDDEFLDIGAWLYKHFDAVSGISFLPWEEHSYTQAPYEEITKEEYEELFQKFPKEFNWNIPEDHDVTEGSQELACVGASCEIN